MRFSERIGLISQKAMQLNDMDESLRNRLYNCLNKAFPYERGHYILNDAIREHALDKLGFNLEESSNSDLNDYFLTGAWYVPYDIIEIVLRSPTAIYKEESDQYYEVMTGINDLIECVQIILEEEKSGYRLLNDMFIPITNQSELDTLDEASNTKFETINIHLRKAIDLYSNRKKPDYENSIKESISAVESLCCIITGAQGRQATLSKTLRILEEKGIVIHGALQDAFVKIYGFTSDSDGIRHGGIDFTNAPIEDAKFMLISCSAFINYLLEKWSKLT